MSQSVDSWFVRLPDGQVFRASSTSVLRHQLDLGQIPFDSRVRRTVDEEWVALEWTREFGDLISTRTVARKVAVNMNSRSTSRVEMSTVTPPPKRTPKLGPA